MTLEPGNKPLFTMGSVDVLDLNKQDKELGLAVHVVCWEHELQTEETKEKTRNAINHTLEYLEMEGFVPSMKNWKVAVVVMGHSPKQ